MELLHWTTLRDKVQADLDLKDEGFIEETELLGYFNEAIDEVESSVHTIYEDYFLTLVALPMVVGNDLIALPSNIFAAKIRKIFFVNGSIKYEIPRIKNLRETMFVEASDDYRYILTNSENTGYRAKVYPVPRDTISLSIWYIRNAKKLTLSTTDSNNVCDIPEFYTYVLSRVKERCYEKEMSPNTVKAQGDSERLKILMVETLTNMVPDEDTKIQMDDSFYRDFDYEAYFGM